MFPAFPVHAQPAILRIWQEAHVCMIPRSSSWRFIGIYVRDVSNLSFRLSFLSQFIQVTTDLFGDINNISIAWCRSVSVWPDLRSLADVFMESPVCPCLKTLVQTLRRTLIRPRGVIVGMLSTHMLSSSRLCNVQLHYQYIHDMHVIGPFRIGVVVEPPWKKSGWQNCFS